SDKLFADAAREEAQARPRHRKSSRLTALENEHENWDGDERIEDAVLRMLVDKYKPLRTGAIQSADQKLKLSPPSLSPRRQVVVTPKTPSTGSWATEPLLPSKKDHQPWHTTFKVPEHATSSIKYASLPLLPPQPSMKATPVDEKLKKKERDEKKRLEKARRLGSAKEATLDYRLGIRGSGGGGGGGGGGQVNPVSMKGWTSLVEDKIEVGVFVPSHPFSPCWNTANAQRILQKARQAGVFQNIKGRGKPLISSTDEANPFIAREEFLMNRIVQRNGAVPQWVELQGELDNSVSTFRELLRQAWIRRVVNVITSTTPAAFLHTFTMDDIKAFRDKDWERREHAYHQVALDEVNALVRKYNGVAPYQVRRPYYTHNVEMEKLFEDSAEDIHAALQERIKKDDTAKKVAANGSQDEGGESSSRVNAIIDGNYELWRLQDVFRAWLHAILSKFRRRHQSN
ncbi:hypothetical protein H0H93_012343, partial [Arthromyces matolae]